MGSCASKTCLRVEERSGDVFDLACVECFQMIELIVVVLMS